MQENYLQCLVDGKINFGNIYIVGEVRRMDSKDFKKIIEEKLKTTSKKALSVYSYKQRQSRPRVKKDITKNTGE